MGSLGHVTYGSVIQRVTSQMFCRGSRQQIAVVKSDRRTNFTAIAVVFRVYKMANAGHWATTMDNGGWDVVQKL